MTSTCRQIVILGSDTDIWVYGMAFMDCGWLENKEVFVEKAINSEYVHLNTLGQSSISSSPASHCTAPHVDHGSNLHCNW